MLTFVNGLIGFHAFKSVLFELSIESKKYSLNHPKDPRQENCALSQDGPSMPYGRRHSCRN